MLAAFLETKIRFALAVSANSKNPVMSPKLRQQIPSSDQLLPQLGDRVLRFQRHWLDLVLEGTKTGELRRDCTTPGRVDGLWRSRLGSHPHWRRCAALLHGGASGHAWSASRGSHRAPLRSTDIPLAFVWTLHSARARPVPQSPRTCDVAALCASTADTCAGCAPGVRTCCCWPFSVRRCLRLQRTPPSAIPLSTCSSSVSCACHGVHRSRRWLGGSCHGGRTRLPSQLD